VDVWMWAFARGRGTGARSEKRDGKWGSSGEVLRVGVEIDHGRRAGQQQAVSSAMAERPRA
jgi:hypothetical protein